VRIAKRKLWRYDSIVAQSTQISTFIVRKMGFRMRWFREVALLFLVAVPLSGFASADTWPGFRGAAGDGISNEAGFPLKWSETEEVAWSTALRGVGNSSPAVTNSRVYLTAFEKDDQSLWVIAVDRKSGRVAWEKKVGRGPLVAYGPPELYNHRHDPATSSPCADADENVYAFFGTGDLVCLDREGEILWQRNLADEYGPYDLKYGMGSSPRLWGDRLYVECVHKGPSYVLALNRKTGKEEWLADRNYPGLGDAPDAYSSPVILQQANLPPQLIVCGCDHVDGYDLSTGKRIWFDRGLLLPKEEYARTIISPAVGEGVVVANSAKGQVCIAIQGNGEGDVTGSDNELWKGKGMADCPTPTIHGGLVYSVQDNGVATCFDLRTGKEQWKKRMAGDRQQASPIVADGRVYFLSLEGKCSVIDEGREYQLLSENALPVGQFYATPAFSNGMIFFRERSRLYAVGRTATAAR
jgi:outer membrane protein assembly factor BamB